MDSVTCNGGKAAQTNAERQAAYRARKAKQGLASFTAPVMLNDRQRDQLNALARQMAENPNLDIATLRDIATGRFRSFTL